MVDLALSSSRLIGMIQPGADKKLCRTGTAGRIVAIEETDDGRYLMTLRGVCRFDVAEELSLAEGGFRRVRPDWSPYRADLTEDQSSDVCRDKLVNVLKDYLQKKDMSCAQWEQIRAAGCEKLMATLTMVCPFAPQEKQALLEAKTLKSRADMLLALLDIARQNADVGGGSCH
jgi:Lon protease-like protein